MNRTDEIMRGLRGHSARVVPLAERLAQQDKAIRSVLTQWIEYAEFNGISNEDLIDEIAAVLVPLATEMQS